MVKATVLVDRVSEVPAVAARGLEAAPARLTTVKFTGGKAAALDMTTPRSAVWADVLDSRRRADQPVYVEIDPETNQITELLLPLTVRVEQINPLDKGGDVEVELVISHARHYLRRKRAGFDEMLKSLQAARKQGTEVLVTETPNDHEIIDVRPAAKPKARRRK